MRTLREIFWRLPADGALRDALRRFNLSPRVNGKAVSVKELAEKLGLSVYQVDLPKGMAGRLVSDAFSDSGYGIEVNVGNSVRSRRFTVLHELGHYLLHLDRTDPLADPMYLDRGADSFYFDTKQETEANQFAATMLFGDGSLQAAVTLWGRDKAKLSHAFGVSEQTIEIALRQFL